MPLTAILPLVLSLGLFALIYRLIDELLLLLHRKTKYTHITFNERYIKNIKI